MKDLIEKLEAADEPSRELDAEIYAFSDDANNENWGKREAYEVKNNSRYLPRWRTKFVEGEARETDDELPYFSSSIDAAMTFIPEGWYLTKLEKFAGDDVEAALTNRVFNGITVCGASKLDYQFAICIAALSAMEKMNNVD